MPRVQGLSDIEISFSRLRLLWRVGAGVLMTAASAAIAFNWHQTQDAAGAVTALGYFGLLFFGLATCRIMWLSVASRKPVVFISDSGIRDTRISDEVIAWGSVEKISIWQFQRQKAVILKVAPLVAERLERTGRRRLLSFANRMLGADGVIINAAGLTMDADTLMDTCEQYRAAFLRAHGVGPAVASETIGDAKMLSASVPSAAVAGLAGFQLPWLTFLILTVLVVIFVLENLFAVTPNVRSDPTIATLFALGALSKQAIWSGGQWYRLFTAPLLHANVAHLFGNGVALLMGGWLLERFVGRLWFFAIFVIAALGGSLMSLAVGAPDLVSVGASGALMGLFAALCVGSFHLPSGTPARGRMQFNSARVLVPSLLPLFSTSNVHIDYGAHFGGALSGAAVAAVLLQVWPATERLPQLRKLAAVTSVVGAILFVAGAGLVIANYPTYRAAALKPLPARIQRQNPLPAVQPNPRPQPDPSRPENPSDVVLDHGPGRVACDLQWSRSPEKSADNYPDFLRKCMRK